MRFCAKIYEYSIESDINRKLVLELVIYGWMQRKQLAFWEGNWRRWKKEII